MRAIPLRAAFGVDIAFKTFDVAFGFRDIDYNFHLGAKPKQFKNTPAGVRSFLKWCKQKLRTAKLAEAQVIIEATGVYHEHLLSETYHDKSGLIACLVMPKSAKHFKLSNNEFSKTDPEDACSLAAFGCERNHRPWEPGSENMMEIKALLRYRTSLITKKNMESNQQHAHKIAVVSNKVLDSVVKINIKHLEKQIKAVEIEIEKLWYQDKELYEKTSQIAKGMPGVRWLTVLLVIAETNGFSEITSGKQLSSYAGLDVIENQSGKTTGRTRISKKGNMHLRKGLYMSATCLHRKNMRGEIAAFGRRIKERNPKCKKKATVAMMRKQLLLIRTLYLSGEDYDPKYEANKQLRAKEQVVEVHESIEHKPANEDKNAKAEVKQKDSPDKNMPRLHEVVSPKTTPKTKVEKMPEKTCFVTQ